MCGRIALYTPPARLSRYFDASLDEGVDPEGTPSWNVGPTRDVLGVTEEVPRARARDADEGAAEPERLLATYRWGLVPSWSKDLASGNRLFNARAETVATRSSFRAAFEARRCLVPVDGFYEWRKARGTRHPHFFRRADGAPMAIAGLWEVWRPRHPDGSTGDWLRSCTIITTRAGQDMDGVHDRMPVVLDPSVFEVWLDTRAFDRHELLGLLRATVPGTLAHHRVDDRVGNVRNDDPGLIADLPAPARAQVATQQSILDPPEN